MDPSQYYTPDTGNEDEADDPQDKGGEQNNADEGDYIKISKADWDKSQNEQRALQQKMKDIGNVFSDQGGGVDKQQILNRMLTDPAGYRQETLTEAQKAAALAAQETVANAQAIAEAKAQNPDLLPYEDFVSVNMATYVQELQAKGINPATLTPKAIIDEGMKRTRERLKIPTPAQGQNLMHNMRDHGTTVQPPDTGGVKIADMNREQFEKFRRQALKGS